MAMTALIKLQLEDLEIEAEISYARVTGYIDTDFGTKTEVCVEDVQLCNVTRYRVRIANGIFAAIDESEAGVTEAIFLRTARELLDNREEVAEQIVNQMELADCCA